MPISPRQRRHERLHCGGAGLRERRRAMNPVVDDDEHAASGRVLVRRNGDGVVEVQRAVGRERGGRTHRRRHHDGLSGLDHEVQEIRRFLDRVGAMRDDHAGDVRHGDQLVDAAGQLQPHLVVHVLGADVRDLLAAQIGELLGLRNRGQQLFNADLAGGVAGLYVAGGRAGDRAASGEHDDGRRRCAAACGGTRDPASPSEHASAATNRRRSFY